MGIQVPCGPLDTSNALLGKLCDAIVEFNVLSPSSPNWKAFRENQQATIILPPTLLQIQLLEKRKQMEGIGRIQLLNDVVAYYCFLRDNIICNLFYLMIQVIFLKSLFYIYAFL